MKKFVIMFCVMFLLLSVNTILAIDNCPNNYAPLPTHPEVCIPAAKNLTRIDKIVNRCVAHGMTRVDTEYAAKNLARTCASLVLGGQDWRKAFK